jgi:hypothetical protein
MSFSKRFQVVVLSLFLVALALVLSVFVGIANAEQVWNGKTQILWAMENPCTGEFIWFFADYHYNYSITATPDGGYRTSWHSNINGSGVSDLGVKYQLQEIDRSSDSSGGLGNAYVRDDVIRLKLVGQGPGNNCWSLLRVRFVIANGERQVYWWIDESGCGNG